MSSSSGDNKPDLPVLIVTKGHPFDRLAFFAMLDSLPGVSWTHVEHPDATAMIRADLVGRFATILYYDVPGITFRTPEPPVFTEPPAAFKAGFEALLQAGQPMVFLHHALAGWPRWDRYAEVIGGRFFYQPGCYKGRAYADSGYVFPVRHRAVPVGVHPVTIGLEKGFEIEDELYLHQVLEPDILPLLRSTHRFTQDGFFSAASALRGRMWTNEGWRHPPGTDLLAWARRVGRSPVIYIQCGNDARAYGNPGFRHLLDNAVRWAAGPLAAAWAAT